MQKTALISVYNKTDIEKFAKELVNLGWKIISSGGTAKYLSDAGIKVTDVAEITGMPPILDHRVVTLHPKIFGGLLAENTPEHLSELEKYGIPYIDLVCVDLYPLEEETKNPNATRESVIEKTDIGGPTIIRSSAKGGRIVVCDKDDRKKVLDWLKDEEPDAESFKRTLAAKAEYTVAKYCMTSAEYLSGGKFSGFLGEEALICKYGENAWQTPAFLFKTKTADPLALAHSNFKRLSGEPLSYNNLADLDRLLQTMTHIAAGFDFNNKKVPKIAIGVKHGNPCGVAVGDNSLNVLEKMLEGDLRAIFGGLIMVNFPIGEEEANTLLTFKMPEGRRRLLDGIFAPEFAGTAVEKLKRKGDKCRFLANPALAILDRTSLDISPRFRYVRGGFLQQPNYTFVPNLSKTPFDKSVSRGVFDSTLKDVMLAWAIGCTSNSNTITLVKDGKLLGNGVGQQDRVGAAKLAIFRADDAVAFAKNLDIGCPLGHPMSKLAEADLENAVAYSDSFFPFPDAVEVLINRGIKTIFSTSGSVNDEKIIELCKNKGVNLILIPDAEARGFYQH